MGWIATVILAYLLAAGIFLITTRIVMFADESRPGAPLRGGQFRRIIRHPFMALGSLLVAFCLILPVKYTFDTYSASLSGISKTVMSMQSKTPPGLQDVRNPDTAKLLAFVKTQMPTRVDLDRENRDILGAIHSLSVPGRVTPAHGFMGGLLLWGGVGVWAVGIFFLILHDPNDKGIRRNALRIGTIAAISGPLFSLGGVTLLKSLTFQFFPQTSPSSMNRTVELIQDGTVGPFVIGARCKFEAGHRTSLEDVEKRVASTEVGHSLLVLFVVGSADKRPLSGGLEKNYGSNRGLAEARADWVRNKLLHSGIGNLPSNLVVATIRGPSVTGPVRDAQEYLPDRTVRVYGLWTLKPRSGPCKQE